MATPETTFTFGGLFEFLVLVMTIVINVRLVRSRLPLRHSATNVPAEEPADQGPQTRSMTRKQAEQAEQRKQAQQARDQYDDEKRNYDSFMYDYHRAYHEGIFIGYTPPPPVPPSIPEPK